MRRIALAGLLLALTPSVASAASWQPPVVIAPAGPEGAGIYNDEKGRSVVMARDVRGDVAVGWTRADPPFQNGPKHVQLSVKLLGKPWTTPEEVGPTGTQLQAMAMDGKGDVTLGYMSTSPTVPVQPEVRTRFVNGTWSAPIGVGVPAVGSRVPSIAFIGADTAGDALVLFADPTVIGTESMVRLAGGNWQPPVELDSQSDGYETGGGSYGMSANGIGTMMEGIWGLDPPPTLVTRRFTFAHGWEAPVPLFTGTGPDPLLLGSAFALSIASNGDETIAAVLSDGDLVSSSQAAAGGPWAPLVTIGSPGKECAPLELAVDRAGEAVVACSRENITGSSGEQGSTFAAVRAGDGTWGALADVQDQRWGTSTPQLAMTDDGRALLLVTTNPPDAIHDQGTLLLERLPGEPWKPATMPGFDTSKGPIFFWLLGGDGVGFLALFYYDGDDSVQVTGGLQAALLAVPPAVAAGSELALHLVGAPHCSSPAHPCHSGRAVHLTLRLVQPGKHGMLTVDRLRSGHWRTLRHVTVRMRSATERVTLRLPNGRVRVSTSGVIDGHRHRTALYLRIA